MLLRFLALAFAAQAMAQSCENDMLWDELALEEAMLAEEEALSSLAPYDGILGSPYDELDPFLVENAFDVPYNPYDCVYDDF